jgi:hypothetical protein
MDKQEFEGEELKHIEPNRIVKEEADNELDNFFLVLAVIFNDLKGIVLFEKLVTDTYRNPPLEEVSIHAGNYGGVFAQTYKILVANIQEFLRFLNEKENVISSSEFKSILGKTNKDIQARWKDIVDIAFDKTPKNSEFSNYLAKIRNNVAFHYYQSDKNLKKAFCNIFNKKEKKGRNDLAYYTVGENMENTRFFYADAAVEEYLRSAISDAESFDIKYKGNVSKMIMDMNFAISRLLKEYLRNRPK